ncbi:MAG: hypothetical protein IPH59_08825 [bacterium]|nr:hypothetical protein [bacterium]
MISRLNREANAKMDQVEKLLELYKQTQTPSERGVLLETVRISSPDGFSRLEKRILRERVRGMTMEQLVQVIASHRDLSLEQAEELLRDTIFQNLLDRSKLSPVAPSLVDRQITFASRSNPSRTAVGRTQQQRRPWSPSSHFERSQPK